jgi:hypothetical protein
MGMLIFAVTACVGSNDQGLLGTLAKETPVSGAFTEFKIGDAMELVPDLHMVIDDISWQHTISRPVPSPAFSDLALESLGRGKPQPLFIDRSPRGDGDWYMVVAYTLVNKTLEQINPSPLPELIYVADDNGRISIARHFNPDAPVPVYDNDDHLFDTPILGSIEPAQSGSGLLVFEARAASDLVFRIDVVGITMKLPAHLSPEFLSSSPK